MPSKIKSIVAREILDSRGNPTVEVDVFLEDGAFARASTPSGASTGKSEALELRDGNPERFQGRGVLKAVANVNQKIAPKLIGLDPGKQKEIDLLLCELDGTENKSNLGANATLPVSMAVARAAARAGGLPLYQYLRALTPIKPNEPYLFPLPMVNIISGGWHAEHSLDFQDFLIYPLAAKNFRQAVEIISNFYHATKKILLTRGLYGGLADEGGFGPALDSNEEPLQIMLQACEELGYDPGTDIAFALDVASSHFYKNNSYCLSRPSRREMDAEALMKTLESWLDKYPIISLEDPMAEEDWDGWRIISAALRNKIQLLGDDLFTTNPKRLQKGIKLKVANAILIKPNQIGTLSETLEVIEIAKAAGYNTVISTRSGETEDDFICDLALATNAGQIKPGSLARSERLAKYNQLLRLQEQLPDAQMARRPLPYSSPSS